MRKIRNVILFIIFLSIVSVQMIVFADDEFDEEFDFNQLNEFLQDVDSEVNKIPQINSRHAVVYDRCSGTVLYGKKENERCKMASTTKIMSAIVILENVENLESKVKVSSKAAGIGGSRLGLHTNDEVSVKDLLYGLMLCSRK